MLHFFNVLMDRQTNRSSLKSNCANKLKNIYVPHTCEAAFNETLTLSPTTQVLQNYICYIAKILQSAPYTNKSNLSFSRPNTRGK